jgi:glycosyltransferase involved in cell wall biosynthesis
MKIEAVTICKDYSDFLAHTIVFNRNIFDRLVVVTSHEDKETANVCEYYHIECLRTNVFGKDLNKAKAVNVGLSKLERSDWLVVFDSDIIFPPRTRQLIEMARLREDTIYSAHRQMCPSYNEFIKWLSAPVINHECDIYLHNKGFPLGTQIGKLNKHPQDPSDLGWVPIGYYQMWNEKDGQRHNYPEEYTGFANSDLHFGYQWPRERRALIPEFSVIHLQTDDVNKMGQNWESRVTKKFGPE